MWAKARPCWVTSYSNNCASVLPATQITMPQSQPYFVFNPHSKQKTPRKTVATVVFDNKEIKAEMLDSPRSQAKLGFLPGLASEPALLSGGKNVAWVLFQRRSHPGALKAYHAPTIPNLQRAVRQVQLCQDTLVAEEKHTKAIWILGALSHKMPLKRSKGGPYGNCDWWLATLTEPTRSSPSTLLYPKLFPPAIPFSLFMQA